MVIFNILADYILKPSSIDIFDEWYFENLFYWVFWSVESKGMQLIYVTSLDTLST